MGEQATGVKTKCQQVLRRTNPVHIGKGLVQGSGMSTVEATLSALATRYCRQRIRLSVGGFHPWLMVLLCCTSIALFASPIMAAQPVEGDWFDQHATLTVGIVTQLPYEALSPEGELIGLGPDLLRSIIGTRQVSIKTRPFKNYEELVRALCANEIEMAITLSATAERERCLGFSTSYLEDKVFVMGRNDGPDYRQLQRLQHVRIGILSGSMIRQIVRSQFPFATLVPLAGDEIAPALASERIDVFLGAGALIDYMQVRAPAAGLLTLRSLPGVSYAFRFATNKNNSGLLAALNNGLKKIADVRRFSIISSWLGHYYRDGVHELPKDGVDLTPIERAYLASLPPLVLGYSADWEPLSYIDPDGRPSGMLSDYLAYWSRTLGIRFERARIDSWKDIIVAAAQDKIDIVAGTAPGSKYFGKMLFSDPLDWYPLVLVQRQGDATFSAPAELIGSRVAVVTSELIDSQAAAGWLPGARLVETDTLPQALELLEQGGVDACITSLPAVDILIRQRYAGKLKVSLAINELQPLSMAVSGRHASLLPLLNRALRSMPESERRQLRNHWQARMPSAVMDWREVYGYWLVAALGVLCLPGMLLARWRRHGLLQQLERQATVLQAALDVVPYPMLIKSDDGQLTVFNRAYETQFNLLRSDVRDKHERETAAASSMLQQRLSNGWRELDSDGLIREDEVSYVDDRGQEHTAVLLMSPILAPSGQRVTGSIGLLIDQTESRRAHALAEMAAQRLRDLTNNLTVVVFQLHLSNAGKLTFTFVSGNAVALFGISAQSMMDDERNAMQRVVAEDRDSLETLVRRSAVTLKPVRPMFRADNGRQILWLSGHLVPRRETDGSIIWNGYWSDITKEREVASDAASEAAHAASRAKDEFLAMMSHEIRTPMNGVMGLAEVLEDTPLSNDQAGLVKMMRDSAGTMLAILDDILDYSKIEAGHLSLSYTAVDLRQLCDQTFGLLAGKAQEKRLQLRVLVDARVAARHLVDGTRLRQVLFNLLSNAIKFTAHGSIILSIAVEEEDVDHQRLRMTVEDTGKGISKEQLSRLFEPFVQEDSSISRRFGGTGLGLSICRRLMTMMNGNITLDSIENFGTTAQLELTLAVAERDCVIDALRGQRVRLLLPDYNIRAATQMYLTALGMEIVDDAAAELKIGTSIRPGKIELQWAAFEERPSRTLQLGANPLQWGTIRQACLMGIKSDVRDVNSAEVKSPAPQPLRQERILVAEDNPTNQEVIRRFLQRLNFDCDVANNGREAFEALRTGYYALLLTDCHMPDLDGFSLVRTIREIEHSRHLRRMPVVGITASTRAEDEQLAWDAGMDACLVKPTGLSRLSECLDKLLPATVAVTDGTDETERRLAFEKYTLPGDGPIGILQLRHLEQELGEDGKLTVLRVFRDTLKQDIASMPTDSDVELAAWLHRVKGAIAVMEFATLLSSIEELSVTLEPDRMALRESARSHFLQLCEKAIAQIDGLLPPAENQ
jgi:two-component system, NarL family, sensor histidine kinase EvgS